MRSGSPGGRSPLQPSGASVADPSPRASRRPLFCTTWARSRAGSGLSVASTRRLQPSCSAGGGWSRGTSLRVVPPHGPLPPGRRRTSSTTGSELPSSNRQGARGSCPHGRVITTCRRSAGQSTVRWDGCSSLRTATERAGRSPPGLIRPSSPPARAARARSALVLQRCSSAPLCGRSARARGRRSRSRRRARR